MTDPHKIAACLQQVNDQESFIQRLLIDALGWQIPEDAVTIDDLAYRWDADELRATRLKEKVLGGTVRQIVLPNNPWGIFILDFKAPDVFTTGRGMTGVLREVLQGLIRRKRPDPTLASFRRENLLFICNHAYDRYRFAHFKAPGEDTRTAPMASFGWGPEDIAAVRTICEYNLRALAWPDRLPQTPDEWVAAWASAFDVEKVTKRFYSEYAKVFAKLEGSLKGPKSDEDRRLTAQILMNRLMFLRFVERKGWLTIDNRTDYLQALAEAGRIGRKSIYQSRLRPLFFEALGSPTGDAGHRDPDAVGDVPFLGGGLFEETKQDEQLTDVPDEPLLKVIGPDGLFYRYNFTVEESTPLDVEVAVDPEMLGKVFEELVTGRHESGSYYTPRPVVAFMCREALKGFLTERAGLTPEVAEQYVDQGNVTGIDQPTARKVLDALDNLKAVDPACGSGAYLLGLLHELIRLYELLYNDKLKKDKRSLYDSKLQIISHSLYGVDIDPFATNIAMLRLWLSLVVEADDPVPLPNLDFKIETGDALLGPDPRVSTELFGDALTERADVLIGLKEKYLSAQAEERAEVRGRIDKEISDIAFKLRGLRGRGVIDWRVQFAEVFVKNGGFDVVLANPPYVRKEEIDPDVKSILRSNFASAITGRSDLYCSFYARGVQLLRDGGMQVYVCSSAWLDAGYGALLQDYLLRTCHVRGILDSAVEKQFSTANVNTAISIAQRRKAAPPEAAMTFTLLTAPFSEAIATPQKRSRVIVPQAQVRAAGTVRGEYIGGKWGGKYLRAPSIYKRIFGEMADRFVPLSSLADISGYIHDNNTGPDFGEQMVVWTVRDVETIAIGPDSQGIRRVGVTASGNSRDFAPILFPRTFGTRHVVAWCEPPILGKEFYKVTPVDPGRTDLLVAQLNSTLGIVQREILGIKGLGGGAIKFAAQDVAQFEMISDMKSLPGFREALHRFAHRPQRDIDAELDEPDRREVDSYIFDALGLTEAERQDVYEAALHLVDARRTRARGVTT